MTNVNCPKNSEIKAGIKEVLDAGFEGVSKELKARVIEHMGLNEAQIKEPTESGKGIRFNVRFSVQLSELLEAEYAIKEEDKTIHKNNEVALELVVDNQDSDELEEAA